MALIFNCDASKLLNYVEIFNTKTIRQLENTETYISNCIYWNDIILEEQPTLFSNLRKQWYLVQNVVLQDINIPYEELMNARNEINLNLNAIIESYKSCSNDKLRVKYRENIVKEVELFLKLVIKIETFDDKIFFKLSNSQQNTKCPIKHYFHTYLEIKLYALFIFAICEKTHKEIEKEVKGMMLDFVAISRKVFKRDCIEKSAFICPCLEKLWMIVRLAIGDSDSFTKILNDILEQQDSLFVIWFLKGFAELESTSEGSSKSNYLMLEKKLKQFITSQTSLTILDCLSLTDTLVFEYWTSDSKVEIFLLLWEHFGKRLNVSQKYSTDNVAMEAIDFYKLSCQIVINHKNTEDDFEFFIGMLVKYLQNNPMHWGKIKCRLFSQINPYKMHDLDDVGTFKVLVFYTCLITVHFEEMSKKIVQLYGAILKSDKKFEPLFWNIYIALILRHLKEGKSIENLTPIMQKLLIEASENNKFHLIKNYLNNFDHILDYSDNNMQLFQWQLIDKWLEKYLAKCYFADLQVALDVLTECIQKVCSSESWSQWEKTFKENVYPALKTICNSSTVAPVAGKLAGKICSLNQSLFLDAFVFFNNENINYKITREFLCVVLEQVDMGLKLSRDQEIVALQSWLKICLLSLGNYKEITSHLVKLDIVPSFLKSNLVEHKDPLFCVIETLGNDAKKHIESLEIIRFCEHCFNNADTFIAPFLKNPENEAVILRIYTLIAVAFLKCGSLMYDRRKTSCVLTKLVSSLLFPMDFLTGKAQHPQLEALRKTWHLYFEALMKINGANDVYIERTLRDLIVKYLPLYQAADSPLFRCLSKPTSGGVVLEKMAEAYFRHPAKESEQNILKALKILIKFVQSLTQVELLKLLISKTLYGLCTLYIFNNNRGVVVTLLIDIVKSPVFEGAKEDFNKVLETVTKKHIAFNTKDYFNLINMFAKNIPNEMAVFKDAILENIKNVERMRGVGFDNNLRSQYENFKSSLRL